MVSKQVLWTAERFKEAFPVKSFMATFPDGTQKRVIWLRGFFYYIVSLDRNDPKRQIPAKAKGTTRTFGDKGKPDYKDLSGLWVKAQLAGLIDSTLIWDNRNDFMRESTPRVKKGVDYRSYDADSRQYYDMTVYQMNTLEEFRDSIDIYTYLKDNHFTNQWYEILVITEKLTVKTIIEPICDKYGANSLAVKGQQSYTRVSEICKKAKREGRPLLLLGIYDLDCAGWDMPYGFMKRVHQTYPHKDHRFLRIALTRKQAEDQNLPISFEPDSKGYPPAQKQRFYTESKGRTCIELDALDNQFIVDELEKFLIKFSGVKIDKIQKRRLKKKEDRKNKIVLDAFEVSEKSERIYNRAFKRYQLFYDEVDKIKDYLSAKYGVITDKVHKIEDDIKQELERMLNAI